jgi:hypothetical protein
MTTNLDFVGSQLVTICKATIGKIQWRLEKSNAVGNRLWDLRASFVKGSMRLAEVSVYCQMGKQMVLLQ